MFKPFFFAIMATCLSVPAQASADALEQMRALGLGPNGVSIELLVVDAQDTSAAANAVLKPGDRIAFALSGVEGAALFILNMDAAGAVQMIYPNRFAPRPGPQPDTLALIPAEGADYVLEVSGEPGPEVIKLFALDADAAAFNALMSTLFDRSAAFPSAKGSAEDVLQALTRFVSETGAGLRTATLDYRVER
ncbi:DUF4384 domain-containing protein [Roseovarius sp. LXJ103]|uniref:DUF4384 domain-containing protein n=1 Tax=Roseovarius carneus TaxID=2853164 RepID=UPI000D61A79C|nr:DUF4384 domain-containing protein [Roseovarius carneus]MBZ8118474.1 DUF4384 domain-containing protein [Roseovarius carneus]PWE35828.1 hypothetical protein DD563_07570 [Pelagicola sp. LXJ1103]